MRVVQSVTFAANTIYCRRLECRTSRWDRFSVRLPAPAYQLEIWVLKFVFFASSVAAARSEISIALANDDLIVVASAVADIIVVRLESLDECLSIKLLRPELARSASAESLETVGSRYRSSGIKPHNL